MRHWSDGVQFVHPAATHNLFHSFNLIVRTTETEPPSDQPAKTNKQKETHVAGSVRHESTLRRVCGQDIHQHLTLRCVRNKYSYSL